MEELRSPEGACASSDARPEPDDKALQAVLRRMTRRLDAAHAELRLTREALARTQAEAEIVAARYRAGRHLQHDSVSRALDAAQVLAFILDPRGRIVSINRAAAAVTGYAASEIEGAPFVDTFIRADERKAARAVLRVLTKGAGGARSENQWLTKSGAPRRIVWSAGLIRDATERASRRIVAGTDVTELRAAERRELRRRAENSRLMRIVAVNEMGGLIAHELNQPLTAILSYAGSARRIARHGAEADGRLVETIGKIEAQAGRAADMIDRMRKLARGSAPLAAAFDINAAVASALCIVAAEAQDQSVRLVTRLETGLPPAYGNALQIEQVAINVVRNGIEAVMSRGSRRRRVTVETARQADGLLRVTVADTGPGFPRGMDTRTTDGFRSTKQHGLGIGLSICRTIVANHGGTLTLANRRGGGAVVGFTLPIRDADDWS